MHYIRLVRPASLDTSKPNALVLSLKLTITTDLGDTFLSTAQSVKLSFDATRKGETAGGSGSLALKPLNGDAVWSAGMRVLKVDLLLTKDLGRGHVNVRIQSRPWGKAKLSVNETQFVLPWRMKQYDITTGLIAPLQIELTDGVGSDVAVRPFWADFPSGDECTSRSLDIEEEIGESIARHIWDAGLVTTALLADACRWTANELRISDFVPIAKDNINILELGCGVGILGIGLAMVIPTAAKAQGVELEQASILLTDLPEAEERARANIERFNNKQDTSQSSAGLLYENLDWEDGSKGNFGPIVSSRFWDYVVLSDCTYNVDYFPVLVETLSSLHSHNIKHTPASSNGTTTNVILSTKPRHDSEKALFLQLKDNGWKHHLLKSIPLLKLGDKNEVVEVYSLEKRLDLETNRSKKRRTEAGEDVPVKKTTAAKP
ncbi:upf0665 family protein c [Seiridium cupressi]